MNTYDEVFEHYHKISQELMLGKNNILKTDCYNEGFGRPIITTEPARLIEYDPHHIAKAKQANPNLNIVQGDIRALPFETEFDLLLDLSTLDHIPQQDIEAALLEYKRVLKQGGQALIITWFTENGYQDIDWQSTNQYFFDFPIVEELIKKHFTIDGQQHLFSPKEPKGCFLYQFILRKS